MDNTLPDNKRNFEGSALSTQGKAYYILLDHFMVPKITDFGLSRFDDKSQTMSANRCMTLGYCAPEYLHAGRMSFKSDMYSLGVIIMQLVTGLKSVSDNDHNSVLRRWRHRWNKSSKETPLLHQQLQVIKCMKIGLLCQEHDPCKRPFILDVIRDLNEMECTYGRIRNANESPIGQIISYAEDDMLGIEPLEIHFTFELNKCMSSSLQLNNGTDSCMAFNIQTTSPLPFCMLPNKGIVLPRSNCTVYITLEPHHEVPQHANELIVRSTKVNNGLKVEDINKEMFNRQRGKVVDEVILDVVFDTDLHMGVSESRSMTSTWTAGSSMEQHQEQLSSYWPSTTKDAARTQHSLSFSNHQHHTSFPSRAMGSSPKVVLYVTTMGGIPKTFEECNAVRAALDLCNVKFEEKDLFDRPDNQKEVKNLLVGTSFKLPVPVLCINGRAVGGSLELRKLVEEGRLGGFFK